MFKRKANVIGFTILISVIGALIAASRKYYLQKVGVQAVTVIDAFLTGTIIITMVLAHKSTTEITKDMKKLTTIDWLICLATSFGIASSIIIGRNLLLHNDLAYLTIIDGGIDLIATAIIAYMFYNEAMTIKKIFGIILVLAGLAILH